METTKPKQPRLLKLTIEKKWFDMILAGEKTEDYREIKFYWAWRLTVNKECTFNGNEKPKAELKDYDLVEFINGYSKKSPRLTVECKGLDISTGKTEWGAIANQFYFVVKLGRVLHSSNI